MPLSLTDRVSHPRCVALVLGVGELEEEDLLLPLPLPLEEVETPRCPLGVSPLHLLLPLEVDLDLREVDLDRV